MRLTNLVRRVVITLLVVICLLLASCGKSEDIYTDSETESTRIRYDVYVRMFNGEVLFFEDVTMPSMWTAPAAGAPYYWFTTKEGIAYRTSWENMILLSYEVDID